MADVEAVFVSTGCNRSTRCMSWGPCDLIAFGFHYGIGIFSPRSASILLTLPGHKDLVTCVEWLPQTADAEEHFLLSGSADGMVMLWGFNAAEKKWRSVSQVSQTHGNSVTCISCIMLSPTEALFVSAAYQEVRVWSVSLENSSDIILVESISTLSWSVLATSLARLPNSSHSIVLALGGFDKRVRLYTGTKTGQFAPACELKGHQDWIRSLHFSGTVNEDGEDHLFLVSSSQDKTIRIWKLVPKRTATTPSSKLDLWTYMETPDIKAGGTTWQVLLESLIVGHEDWVYSVCWQPCKNQEQPLAVLSSSMDKTMMIWRPHAKSGLWMNDVTVGELAHSPLGFFGGVWSPDGDAILAHGYYGSFHLWKREDDGWIPQLVPSGHFSSVVDVAWAKTGQFLLSASQDQTTRVFTNWNKDPEKLQSGWREIARPQVHGHDMNCLAVVQGKGNHRYVSGGDEKVARVFEAPTAFLDTVSELTTASQYDFEREDVQIFGANMSALGLSQKPIFTPGEVEETVEPSFDSMDEPNAIPKVLTRPPLEEQLAQNTLWPEAHKLYGHGNELFSMCSSHSGSVVATACKAQTPTVAEIWLWETQTWRPLDRLRSHSLTVTQLEFSSDDRFLLSVSRDRHLSLFQRGSESYGLVAYVEAHKRIVWTCSWSPCSTKFATGSRDKVVKVWRLVEDGESATKVNVELHVTLPSFKSSVNALAWGQEVLAVGMESGLIELWSTSLKMSCLKRLDPQMCHVDSVNRLRWKNVQGESDEVQQLASCGTDRSLRLFNVRRA